MLSLVQAILRRSDYHRIAYLRTCEANTTFVAQRVVLTHRHSQSDVDASTARAAGVLIAKAEPHRLVHGLALMLKHWTIAFEADYFYKAKAFARGGSPGRGRPHLSRVGNLDARSGQRAVLGEAARRIREQIPGEEATDGTFVGEGAGPDQGHV